VVILYRKGKLLRRVSEGEAIKALLEEIEAHEQETAAAKA